MQEAIMHKLFMAGSKLSESWQVATLCGLLL